jgi:hypothetical protein
LAGDVAVGSAVAVLVGRELVADEVAAGRCAVGVTVFAAVETRGGSIVAVLVAAGFTVERAAASLGVAVATYAESTVETPRGDRFFSWKA